MNSIKPFFSSLVTTAAAGMALAMAGIFFTPEIINILNIPPELKRLCIPFTRIYAAGLLFHYLLINYNGVLRSCNMTRSSLKTMALVCAINIGLNFFYVFYTPLSFRGIALDD
jgi:Na+-driven multidrug efflux pump